MVYGNGTSSEVCTSEFIDGTYTFCGCSECDEREHDAVESDFESGYITESEAHERHYQIGWTEDE